jgi:hypothetical protein
LDEVSQADTTERNKLICECGFKQQGDDVHSEVIMLAHKAKCPSLTKEEHNTSLTLLYVHLKTHKAVREALTGTIRIEEREW